MPLAAGPLIELLEVKQKEIEKVIEQKSMIKNQQSNSASDNSHNSQPGEDTKSWTTNGSVYEALDESVINKNSFCIILGSFIRRSAVSPKTVNMAEFSLMLNSFKAMFDLKNGDSFIQKAVENKSNYSTDIVNFKEEINLPAMAQHLGMLTHLRAWGFVKSNAMHKGMKMLWIEEGQIHPSCLVNKTDSDIVYQKCV